MRAFFKQGKLGKIGAIFLVVAVATWCARPFGSRVENLAQSLLLIQLLNPPKTIPTHLYAADGTGMYAMSIDSNSGVLSGKAGPFGAGNNPSGIAISSDNKELFVSAQTTNAGVYAFSLAQPSNPAAVSGSPFAAGISAFGMTVSPRFLFFTPGSSQVRPYSMDTNSGALTDVPGTPFGVGCVQVLQADPQSRFLFANDGFGGTIQSYLVSSAGALSGLTSIAASTNSFASDLQGKRLFANGASSSANNLFVYDVNQTTGALTQVSGSPYSLTGGAINARYIAVDPRGRFVYIMNQTAGGIFGFSMNSTTGGLTPVAGNPLAVLTPAQPILITADGEFLYAATGTGIISGFRINGDGTLTQVTTMSGLGGGNVGLASRFIVQ